MTVVDDDRISETFAALANPTRRAIVARLAESDANVNDLAEPFDMTLPAISRHINVLERAGLLVQGRRARFRPCTLDPRPLEAVAAWTEQYRPIWEDRFDRMADDLDQIRDDPSQPTSDTVNRSPARSARPLDPNVESNNEHGATR